jgi:hypothetical protein
MSQKTATETLGVPRYHYERTSANQYQPMAKRNTSALRLCSLVLAAPFAHSATAAAQDEKTTLDFTAGGGEGLEGRDARVEPRPGGVARLDP